MVRRALILSLLFTGACGPLPGSSTSGPRSGAGEVETPEADLCVMQVPGVGLQTEELPDGFALIFETIDDGSVPTLRRSAQLLAAAYAQGALDHAHEHAEGAPAPAEHYAYQGFEDARITVEPIDGGVRIELRALHPESVDAIRQRAAVEVRMMRRGACPLLPPDLEPMPLQDEG